MIRILLVDHREAARQLLARALEPHAGIGMPATAGSAMQAVSQATRTSPDVACVNVGMPNGEALQATRLMTRRFPRCRVLLINGEPDPRFLLSALEAGARGYLTRRQGMKELLTAIQVVHRGELAVPRDLLAGILPIVDRRRTSGAWEHLSALTAQEQRVLLMLLQGANNRAIGELLGISLHTARTHVHNVLNKLGVHSRLEAVAYVKRNDLLDALEEAVRSAPDTS